MFDLNQYVGMVPGISDIYRISQLDDLILENGRVFFISDCHNQSTDIKLTCNSDLETLLFISESENCKILHLDIFKPDDQVILVGEFADEIVQASGMERVISVHAANEALRFIENFKGDVYIKGHRSYKLEQLIV